RHVSIDDAGIGCPAVGADEATCISLNWAIMREVGLLWESTVRSMREITADGHRGSCERWNPRPM
ncbi:hypothetical protein KI387_005913, partial [Taxus chinensis]